MKLYADLPRTRLRQLVTDALAVLWAYAWVRLGLWLYHLVSRLAAPGRRLEAAGTGMADNLGNAGRRIDRVPGVGDALASPFGRAADAARSIASAGHDETVAAHDLALVLAIAVVAVPLALVLLGWLPLRVRWMRRAGAAAALRTGAPDLLALRALATQPLRRLAKLDQGIAAAWRRGDPDAVAALAALELRWLGLRPATPLAQPTPRS